MMNDTTRAQAAALGWLAAFDGHAAPPPLLHATLPNAGLLATALATLAAEALARDRSLLVVTPDDELLPEISNALDLGLRPLCLVLPGADYASRIALRATISLLKSRLSRDGDDTQGPAWRAQRARLAAHDDLWHDCLAWCARSGDRDSWPPAVAPFFPVRFAPRAVATSLLAGAGNSSDWVVVIGAEACGASSAWPTATATLLLHGAAPGPSAMVPVNEAARLRVEFELLGQELAELELELATAQAEIVAFTERYHRIVGKRMTLLDALQAEVALLRAEAEPHDGERYRAAREAAEQAIRSSRESSRHGGSDKCNSSATGDDGGNDGSAKEAAETGFRPSIDVKKLYRQIAQKIHPDRASDEADRAWRTELMSEANRAYRSGDRAALQEILASWQESTRGEAPGDGTGKPARETRGSLTLARQVMRLRRRIAEIEAELNQIYGSRLYELFAAAKVARRQGRDLLQEMAERLDTQIADIQAALAAVEASVQ